MGEPPWRWFDNLFPTLRWITMTEGERQYQRGGFPVQVSTGHPGPGKCLPAVKCNLALCDAQLHISKTVDHSVERIENLPGLFLPCEKFIQRFRIQFCGSNNR